MQLGALHRSEHNAQADHERKQNRQQDMHHDEHDSAAKSSALECAKVSVIAGAQRSTVCCHACCEATAKDMYTSVEAETGV